MYVQCFRINNNKTNLKISSKPSRREEMDLSRHRAIDFPYLLNLRKTPVVSIIICPPTDTLNYPPLSITEIVVTLYNNARR